jgi:hypothetical protein
MVFTSNGSQIVVLDVVALGEAEARGMLACFAVIKTGADTADPNRVGKVFSMTPAAGAGADPSTVQLSI